MICSFKNLTFYYGDTLILDSLTANINEGDKIALIGGNGTGKSTLLKLLTKQLVPNEGELFHKTNLSIGYLAQNSGLDSNLTIIEELRSVFKEIYHALDSIQRVYEQLSTAEVNSLDYKNLCKEQSRLESFILAKDGYNVDVNIKTMINGMGFSGEENKSVCVMSGGEKTRLAFAKVLLSNPDFLILDEPTNHLDIDTLNFLEKYLVSYKGVILMVSHDRYFIDKICNRVWELENHNLHFYNGNYSTFKVLRAERIDRQTKEYERQSQKIANMLDYAERNIARASTSKSARSRLKQIDNMELVEKPYRETRPPKFNFLANIAPAKAVLTLKNLDLTIGDNLCLAKNINATIERGSKVAILGKNGTGKSTLIRKIMYHYKDTLSQLDSFCPIKFGVNVTVGYYDQENRNIDQEKTVLEAIWNDFHLESQTTIRSILAQMKLSADDIDKKVIELSGGERAKLGFAIMTAESGNFLIMDEPTNHLDLLSREALEDALFEFDGTLLFVSHDRYFTKRIATKIWELENNALTEYAMPYNEFFAQKQAIKQNAQLIKEEQTVKSKETSSNYRSDKERKNLVKLNLELKAIETKIAQLEQEEQQLNKSLSDGSIIDYKIITEKSSRLLEVQQELENAMLSWETVMAKLN